MSVKFIRDIDCVKTIILQLCMFDDEFQYQENSLDQILRFTNQQDCLFMRNNSPFLQPQKEPLSTHILFPLDEEIFPSCSDQTTKQEVQYQKMQAACDKQIQMMVEFQRSRLRISDKGFTASRRKASDSSDTEGTPCRKTKRIQRVTT